MDEKLRAFLQRHQLPKTLSNELQSLINEAAEEKAWALAQVSSGADEFASEGGKTDERPVDPSAFDPNKTLTDPREGEALRDALEQRLWADGDEHEAPSSGLLDAPHEALDESALRQASPVDTQEISPSQESMARLKQIHAELEQWSAPNADPASQPLLPDSPGALPHEPQHSQRPTSAAPLGQRKPSSSPSLSASAMSFPLGGRSTHPLPPEERYEDLGLIGVGGMGEVRRVRDKQLKRVVAMKVIRKELIDEFSLSIRFIEEAQATAQLQHPGIIPLHDIGQLADGRYYFTMKEIKGKTLEEVIRELHEVSKPQGVWSKTKDGWTIRRTLDAFRRVCEAVGYAHSRGALHRDLKPENVMLGAHGEVLVLDWGLVKIKGHQGTGDWRTSTQDIVVTDRSQEAEYVTMIGAITGTPTYMSPEQAKGLDDIDARSDVYALGAVLYEILSGRPPYYGDDHEGVVMQLLEGPPPPLITTGANDLESTWVRARQSQQTLPLTDELVSICNKAMARDAAARHENATALAQAVAEWLEGDQKRERALEMVAQANDKLQEVDQLQLQSLALKQKANDLLEEIPSAAPEEEKRLGWSILDESRRLQRDATLKALESELSLQGALVHYPQLIEARVALAESYKRLHNEAERSRNEKDTLRAEQMLFNHLQEIPPTHPSFQHNLAYLKGDGAITLITDPPGVEVTLFRYVEQHRRLIPVRGRSLGTTPLYRYSLPMGSYLLLLQKEGYADVRYPVEIMRQDLWEGVPPDEAGTHPIKMIRQGEIDEYECYIPAGWFWSGGDKDAVNVLPRRRLWLDGFIIRRFPVIHREYLSFLNALLREGREAEAERLAPRHYDEHGKASSQFVYGRDNKGAFVPRPLSPRELRQQPTTSISLTGARAFAQWMTAQSGQMWLLPDEFEWEKAARGVDGRLFPWGNWMDPSWCCMNESRPEQAPSHGAIDVIESWPIDESPYGVRGMAGNSKDWCANPYRNEGPRRAESSVRTGKTKMTETLKGIDVQGVDQFDAATTAHTLRGGSWKEGRRRCRAASRQGGLPHKHYDNVSFRIIRYLSSS